MATREEFGNYLLLKKITGDPLGETFRAGRLGQQGLDQVLLLRVLNGQGLDGEALWASLAERRELQQALKSPNIGSGVDAGTVRGVPYVAYDYISGKDLATLVAQAQRESSPFPTDHALLIADRIGLALTAAYEARHGGERVLHGMVVPHLAMVSNEGETRLLGFEAGPALAEQASSLPPEVQRYLAPEIRSGGTPTRTGDVFSLGAILYELVSGAPLPATAPEGYAPIVEQAQLAAEGTALPPALADLLERSLAPAQERITDAAAWHKALSKIMSEGGYNATTFNLAFFMHNLFREEIEQESREIEAESTMAIPTRGAAVAGSGAETRALSHEEVSRAAAPTEDTEVVRERYGMAQPAASGGKKGLWIGIAAALLVLVGGGIAYLMTNGFTGSGADEESSPTETTAPQQPVAEPDPVEPAEPEGPSPEEIQAQLDAMLDERTQALQDNIQQEYDQRIAEMQRQLEAAERAAQEREDRLAEARRQEEARRSRESRERQEREAQQAAAAAEAEPEPGSADPDPAPSEQSEETAPEEVEQVNEQPAERPQQRAATEQPPSEPASPEPQAPRAPEEPQVRVGELVDPGPGVTGPRVLRRASPSFPPVAARLNREAEVNVRVLVDENGEVTEARIAGDPSRFGFDEAALEAARASTFEPAEKFGVRVKMWTTLRFVFKR